MTGYTVHTGATKKFSSSWDRIFGGDSTDEAAKAEGDATKQTTDADPKPKDSAAKTKGAASTKKKK